MKNLNEKAIAAAEKFLDRRGNEILSTNWEAPDDFRAIDIVAADEGTIVFVDVKAHDSTDRFPEEDNDHVRRKCIRYDKTRRRGC